MSCKSQMISCPCILPKQIPTNTLKNKDSLCCTQLLATYTNNIQKALPSSEGYYDVSQHVQPIVFQYFCESPRAHEECFTFHDENDRKFQLQITGQHHNIVSLPPKPINRKEPHKAFGFYKANLNQLQKCTIKWCFKIGLSNLECNNNDESDRSEDEHSDDWFYDDENVKAKNEITFGVNSLDFCNRCSLTTDGHFDYQQNEGEKRKKNSNTETIGVDDIITIRLRSNKTNGTVAFYKNSDSKPLISTN
eukprot:477836_1